MKNKIIKNFKKENKHEGWDAWGYTIGFICDLCEYFYHKNIVIPDSLGYIPSPFLVNGDYSDELKDNLHLIEGDRATEDELKEALNILDRYDNLLRKYDQNY